MQQHGKIRGMGGDALEPVLNGAAHFPFFVSGQ